MPGSRRGLAGGFSNPQPNPQKMMSCTTCRYFGSPRVVVSRCKTYPGYAVTAEVASSSLVVPAILLNCLQGTSKSNLGPFGSNKRFRICRFALPPVQIIGGNELLGLVD